MPMSRSPYYNSSAYASAGQNIADAMFPDPARQASAELALTRAADIQRKAEVDRQTRAALGSAADAVSGGDVTALINAAMQTGSPEFMRLLPALSLSTAAHNPEADTDMLARYRAGAGYDVGPDFSPTAERADAVATRNERLARETELAKIAAEPLSADQVFGSVLQDANLSPAMVAYLIGGHGPSADAVSGQQALAEIAAQADADIRVNAAQPPGPLSMDEALAGILQSGAPLTPEQEHALQTRYGHFPPGEDAASELDTLRAAEIRDRIAGSVADTVAGLGAEGYPLTPEAQLQITARANELLAASNYTISAEQAVSQSISEAGELEQTGAYLSPGPPRTELTPRTEQPSGGQQQPIQLPPRNQRVVGKRYDINGRTFIWTEAGWMEDGA